MAFMSTPRATSSSASSLTPRWKYDVFLSFRGEDTRNNFTDHLYAALQHKGIFTFRDEEELERGESISPALLKAIEESRFAIIILSKNYVSSSWCMEELAKIVRCRKETGLTILPIFYYVSPSDVRKQAKTICDHNFWDTNSKEVESWRDRFETNKRNKTWEDALREVANLSGWHLQDSHESEYIQHIVEVILHKLSSSFSSNTNNLVGIDSSAEEFITSYYDCGNKVCMTGICGMGGLGKTTLARVVYDKFCSHFEGSSFIANVREESEKYGLLQLQKQLLADILEDRNIDIRNVYQGVDMIKKRLHIKKVLLVLDDVNQIDQLEKLCGEYGWFGLESWIIITTRDEHLLFQHGVHKIFKPNSLNSDVALKLFCLKAFKNEQPKEGYMQLSQECVLPVPYVAGYDESSHRVAFTGLPGPLLAGIDESSRRVAFTILNRYLQGLLCQKTDFQTIIEMKNLPRWLTHQSLGNSISIELPPNWCNGRWMGFVLCANVNVIGETFGLGARVIALGDMPHSHYASKTFFRTTALGSHIWLLYFSRDDWFATVGNGECSQIELVFENYGSVQGVRKCGVSLVYEQDVEEFNQTIARSGNSGGITSESIPSPKKKTIQQIMDMSAEGCQKLERG